MNRRLLGLGLAALPLVACTDGPMSPLSSAMAVSPDRAPPGATPPALRLAAAQGGTFLMESARLGAAKARSAALRRWAPFEVSEQEALTGAMALLGAPTAAPPALPDEKATTLRALGAANGAAFDRLFVASQVTGHQEAMGVFEAIARGIGNVPGDRAIALMAVDRIREHLAFLASVGGARA